MSTHMPSRHVKEAPRASWGQSVLFLCAYVALGAALALVGGEPRLPVRPDARAIREALLSSDLRLWHGAASWLFAFGWLVWAWTALSLLLQAALFALEALTRGAAWARALRRRVNLSPLVMPLARRAFPVIAAATIVLRSGVTPAGAAPVSPAPLVLLHDTPAPLPGAAPTARQEAPVREHVVMPGDRVATLAARYYGTDEEFTRIHEANIGRIMPDGSRYLGRIMPGQVLLVPAASYAVEEVDGETMYTVERHDTLYGIAARLLDDPARWPEIFEANVGVARMPDGRVLSDPRLIWPGLRLVVPDRTAAPANPDRANLPTTYVAVRGDTLRKIAFTFYGEESLWPEIAEASRDLAREDGFTLANPDRIWPGQRFVIPVPAGAMAPTPAVAPAPLPSPVPEPPVSPVAPTPSPAPPTSPVASTPAPPPTVGGPATGATAGVATPTIASTPASPTPAVPTAAATPPAAVATPVVSPADPVVVATPVVTPIGGELPAGAQPGRAPLATLGGGLAGAALLGGAIFATRRLWARRELRRRLRTRVAQPVVIRELHLDDGPADFADPELAQTFTHRAYGGEVEPAVAIAHHAARFFDDHETPEATVLLAVQEQESDASLLVSAPRAEQDRLVALTPDLGQRLGGKARGVPVRGGGDVEMRFKDLTDAGILALFSERSSSRLPTMMPFVELSNQRQLFANWDALGHVLVAGLPGEGADIVLTGLVAMIASRRHPDTLRLWTVSGPQLFPAELFLLPHWADEEGYQRIDPADLGRVSALLADLREELDLRRGEPRDTVRPDLVVVLGELADLTDASSGPGDLGTTLSILLADGPAYGIRLLAAAMRPDRLDEGVLRYFATRLVLHLAEEGQSMRLLGTPDALELEGGGQLLLRLAGHAPRHFAGLTPARTRGFRIGSEALVQLAQQMRGVYRDGEAAPLEEEVAVAPTPTGPSPVAPTAAQSPEGEARAVPEPSGQAARQVMMPTAPLARGVQEVMGPIPVPFSTATEGPDGSGVADEAGGGSTPADHREPGTERAAWAEGEGEEHERGIGIEEDRDNPIVVASPAGNLAGGLPVTGDLLDEEAGEEDSPSAAPVAGAALVFRPAPLAVAVVSPPPVVTSHQDTPLDNSLDDSRGDETAEQDAGRAGTATAEPVVAYSNGHQQHGSQDELVGLCHSECALDGQEGPNHNGHSQHGYGSVSAHGHDQSFAESPALQDNAALVDRVPGEPAALTTGAQEQFMARLPDTRLAAASADASDEDTVPTPLEIRCFGRQFRVLSRGEPLQPFRGEKAWELLQYLAAQPHHSVNRQKLRAALWPDMGSDSKVVKITVGRLRDELTRQVPDLPREVVHQDRNGDVWLDPQQVTVDVHVFLDLSDRAPKLPTLDEALAAYRRVDAIYRPELLDGAGYDWLDDILEGLTLAEEYHHDWRQFVLRLARRCVNGQRPDLAVPLYQRLMHDAPLNEEVLRELLRCYGATGNLQGFNRELRTFEQALRKQHCDAEDGPTDAGYDPDLDGPEPQTCKVRDEVLQGLNARLADKDGPPTRAVGEAATPPATSAPLPAVS